MGDSAEVREERDCPGCAERILVKARFCKHCGRGVNRSVRRAAGTLPLPASHNYVGARPTRPKTAALWRRLTATQQAFVVLAVLMFTAIVFIDSAPQQPSSARDPTSPM